MKWIALVLGTLTGLILLSRSVAKARYYAALSRPETMRKIVGE